MNFEEVAKEIAAAKKRNPDAKVYINSENELYRVAIDTSYASGYRGYHDQLAIGDQSLFRDAITVYELHKLLTKLATKKMTVNKKGSESHVDVQWSRIWFANGDETRGQAVSSVVMSDNKKVVWLYTEAADY